MTEGITSAYKRVRFAPEEEIKAISVLMKSGQSFKAVTKTDYIISGKQCTALSRLGIHYISA